MRLTCILNNDFAREWCEQNGIAEEMLSRVKDHRKTGTMFGTVAIRKWWKESEPDSIAVAMLHDGFDKSENNGWAVYVIEQISEGEMQEAVDQMNQFFENLELKNYERSFKSLSDQSG